MVPVVVEGRWKVFRIRKLEYDENRRIDYLFFLFWWRGFLFNTSDISIFWGKWLLNFIFEAAVLSSVHLQLQPLRHTRHPQNAPMTPCCVLLQLCRLLVDCWHVVWFCFLLSVFSCTVPQWGRPLHPLPVPVCSPPAHSCRAFSVSLLINPLIPSPCLTTT